MADLTLAQRFGMDGGGYDFLPQADAERDYPELAKLGAAIDESPDLDYTVGADALPRSSGYDADLFAFVEAVGYFCLPREGWPAELVRRGADHEDNPGRYLLRASGSMEGWDRDCDWCGAGTGHQDDCGCSGSQLSDRSFCASARLTCERCEQDGLIDGPGGCWAIYSWESDPEPEEEDGPEGDE